MSRALPLALPSLLPGLAAAATRTLAPGDDLAAAVAAAAPGVHERPAAGIHAGRCTLDRPLTLRGAAGRCPRRAGRGQRHHRHRPGRHHPRPHHPRLRLSDRAAMDFGVVLTRPPRAPRRGQHLRGQPATACTSTGSPDATVRDNAITGRTGRQADAGNGVMIWNAPGARIENNTSASAGTASSSASPKQTSSAATASRRPRFAIHYMYTSDSEIEDNASIDNTVGYAIMFSDRLKIVGNLSDGDRDHGLMFNSSNGSEIRANCVIGRPALRPPPQARMAPRHREHAHAQRAARPATASARRMPVHLQRQQ